MLTSLQGLEEHSKVEVEESTRLYAVMFCRSCGSRGPLELTLRREVDQLTRYLPTSLGGRLQKFDLMSNFCTAVIRIKLQ